MLVTTNYSAKLKPKSTASLEEITPLKEGITIILYVDVHIVCVTQIKKFKL